MRTKITMFVGATPVKIADPVVVLVVGWVALPCHSKSERYGQFCGKLVCAPTLSDFADDAWCWWAGASLPDFADPAFQEALPVAY